MTVEHQLDPVERTLVTIAVMLAVLIQVLDTTIANVALPHMQASLGATQESINWVLTSYIVASAIALPISGWLADRVGRKRLLFWSVVGFTVASFLCAVAQTLPEMVGFRILQGVSRRLPRAFGPGDIVRHQSTQAPRPGDGAVRRRHHDRADPRPGAGRLADRQFQLALGVPGQHPDRHDRRADAASVHAEDPAQRAHASTCLASRCSALRSAALQLMLDRGQHEDWFDSTEIWIEAAVFAAASWMFVVHTLTAKAPIFEPFDVRRPQFRARPDVHDGHRRAAARRARPAAAAAPAPLRLFGASVGHHDLAARRRNADLDAGGRATGRQGRSSNPGCARHGPAGLVAACHDRLRHRNGPWADHLVGLHPGAWPRPGVRHHAEPGLRHAGAANAHPCRKPAQPVAQHRRVDRHQPGDDVAGAQHADRSCRHGRPCDGTGAADDQLAG